MVLRAATPGRSTLSLSRTLGEFGERRGNPQRGDGVDAEFVVAAAQILQKACPAITICAVRSVCRPRIGLSRRLS
jgi:hypothetical protein